MGNSCAKPSKSNFAGEGRTIGSAPTANAAPPPEQSSHPHAELPPNVSQDTAKNVDRGNKPMSAAGLAAQERMAKANAATGKLSQQLAEQKKQTRTDTLKAVSAEERGIRNAQANTEARNWN